MNTDNFCQQMMIFYQSRLTDEPTGNLQLSTFWFFGNVANCIDMKALPDLP